MSFYAAMDRLAGAIVKRLGEDDLILYRKGEGSVLSVRGVFDDRYQAIDPDTGREVSVEDPRVFVRASDFDSKPERGANVLVRGSAYSVSDVQFDGNAGFVLKLQWRPSDASLWVEVAVFVDDVFEVGVFA